MSRPSCVLACALVLLTPLLCSAYVPGTARVEPDGPGTGSTTVVGVSPPGAPSVAKLTIPSGKRIVGAELQWTSLQWTGTPQNCLNLGIGELPPVFPMLPIGSVRIVAERITAGRHGDIAHANVTERLSGMLAADGSTIAFHGLDQGIGASCGISWTLHVVWTAGKATIDVRTEATPAESSLGDRLNQTAVITNTGDAPLVGVVADLDSGPCRIQIGRLHPGQQRAVSCRGTTPADGQVTAVARGWTLGGWPVHAEASERVQLRPAPQAGVSLDIGPIVHLPGTDAAEVPVTVQNTSSSVPLVDVVVTGRPASCLREVGRLEPGETFSYRCRANRGESVDLTVVARPVIGGVVADFAHLVRASKHALVPSGLPVMPTVPPPGVAPVSPPDAPPVPRQEHTEPSLLRDSPEKAAGFIAILGVLVMMVSVGALSSATRAGK